MHDKTAARRLVRQKYPACSAHNTEKEIRDNIAEIGDTQPGTLIGEMVVGQGLRKSRVRGTATVKAKAVISSRMEAVRLDSICSYKFSVLSNK